MPGAAIAVALFAIVALLVTTGRAAGFDRAILDQLRVAGRPGIAIGPVWLMQSAVPLTWLGAGIVRAPLAICGALVLFAARRRREAALLVGAWGLGLLLLNGLKLLFARARPDLAFRLVEVNALSFPSGHAMGAMILYPLLGLLFVRNRSIGIGAGLGIAILIGLTRVILGVHWASDVIGGWLLGVALALAAAHFARPSVRGRRSPANHQA